MTDTRGTAGPSLSVGLVSPGWPPEAIANGIASYTGTIVSGLRELEARCHVLTLRPMTSSIDDFVHIVRPDTDSVWSRIRRRLDPEAWPQRAFCNALSKEVTRLQSANGLDVLEMEESYGWAAMLPRRLVPTVVRLHGPWFLNGAANGVAQDATFHRRNKAEARGLAAAAGVTAPSADVLRQTRAYFDLALPRAAVIPNPVAVVPVEDRWRLSDCEPQRIAFIGRFDRHKGADIMLDAFARVLRHAPDTRLDFVGPDRGCADDAGRMWSFERYLAKKLPVEARARIQFHGFLPGPKAAELRKRALVTAAPSRYETFGIAAAEAMMAGCPLVVSAAGALAELVQDERNGLVSRPGDADDLAVKLLLLLNDPNRAARLGAQAAKDTSERYDPRIVARQTLDFYRTVLGDGRKLGRTRGR